MWGTKSGMPSTQVRKATGERCLPEKDINSISASDYHSTSRAKRNGTKAVKQFVAQHKQVRDKVKQHRKIT